MFTSIGDLFVSPDVNGHNCFVFVLNVSNQNVEYAKMFKHHLNNEYFIYHYSLCHQNDFIVSTVAQVIR